jgi:hypothetical protein
VADAVRLAAKRALAGANSFLARRSKLAAANRLAVGSANSAPDQKEPRQRTATMKRVLLAAAALAALCVTPAYADFWDSFMLQGQLDDLNMNMMILNGAIASQMLGGNKSEMERDRELAYAYMKGCLNKLAETQAITDETVRWCRSKAVAWVLSGSASPQPAPANPAPQTVAPTAPANAMVCSVKDAHANTLAYWFNLDGSNARQYRFAHNGVEQPADEVWTASRSGDTIALSSTKSPGWALAYNLSGGKAWLWKNQRSLIAKGYCGKSNG